MTGTSVDLVMSCGLLTTGPFTVLQGFKAVRRRASRIIQTTGSQMAVWYFGDEAEGPYFGDNEAEGPYFGDNEVEGPYFGGEAESPYFGDNNKTTPVSSSDIEPATSRLAA
jgi:hypothetical protein